MHKVQNVDDFSPIEETLIIANIGLQEESIIKW